MINNFKFCKFLFWTFALLMSFDVSDAFASRVESCVAAKKEFRTLYLELQAKYLNYSGKDTTLDKNGKIVLVNHNPDAPYEGKDFELAIFKQYQNALKKVGLVYQDSKAKKDEIKDSFPQLVKFLEAIDKDDPTTYVATADINAVVADIAKMSRQKFVSSSNPGHALNKNDEYLLKKLLIHAIDSICGTSHFKEKNKRTQYYTKEQLERQFNAPLNRMIKILKNADITADTDIKIFDEKDLEVNGRVAVHSAIAEHMQRMAKWVKDNQRCMNAIKQSDFIQKDIQPCNYDRFLKSLNSDNFDELESILHFINANDKFIDKREKLADTDINPIFLESMLDQTFDNLGNKIVCTIIPSDSGKNIVFVRNLPYDPKTNKFDTSKISCSIGGKKQTKAYCDANLTFTSNKYGNGLEIGQKNEKGAVIKFSVEGDPNCTDVHSQNNEIRNDNSSLLYTADYCIDQGKKQDPPVDLVLSEDKKSCVLKKDDGLKTQEMCDEEGKKQNPPVELVLSEDKKSCLPKNDGLKTPEMCIEEGKKQNPPVELVLSEDKKSCIPKNDGLKTPEMCIEEGKKQNPPVELVLSEDKKSCIPKNDGLKTQEMCDAEGKEQNPPIKMTLSADKKSCTPVVPDEAAKCEARNKEWIEKENDGRPGIGFDWDGKQCVDKRPKKPTEDDSEAGPPEIEPFSLPEGQPPGRFVPLSNPPQQMYILQGWP